MANSKIGQYQIEYRLEGFTAPVRSHVVRLWVAPVGTPVVGAPPTSIDIGKRGGASANLQIVADQAWSYIRLNYPAAISATAFSLWHFVTANARNFISGGTLATPAGSGAGSVQVAAETMLTFRHGNGGIGKIVLLESNVSGDSRSALVANAAGTGLQRLAAYIMSADGIMTALDNSFPVSPLRDSRGQNEAIWRMVYRAGN